MLLGYYVAKVASQIPTFRGKVVPLLQGWLATEAHQHVRRVVFKMKGILNSTAAKSSRLLGFSVFSIEYSTVVLQKKIILKLLTSQWALFVLVYALCGLNHFLL